MTGGASGSWPAVLSAVAAATAAYLACRPRPLAPRAPGQGEAVGAPRPAGDAALLTRLRPGLAGLVVVGGWTLLGGVLGLCVGVVGAAVTWRVLGRAEAPSARSRREQLERDLPTAVDLLATALASGSSVESALAAVARAVGGPVGDELSTIGHRLGLGVDAATVWRAVSGHEQLGPFGRAALRAHDSGASVALAVQRLGVELRARERAGVEARAKTVEVKAAAPLGVCFLPAFVLLGVVPMVAGVFTSLDFFG
jgi:Flp pilus assembly protein TadB